MTETGAEKQFIDIGLFLRGMAVASLAFILVFAVVWMQGERTVEELESRLASMTVLIERGAVPAQAEHPHEDEVAQPGQTHEPAQHTGESAGKTHPEIPVQELAAGPAKTPLIAAPIADLTEKLGTLVLPVVSKKSGMTPFHAYKRPFTGTDRPMIALIVDDYGLSESASESVIQNLPSTVSLMLSPYSKGADSWQKKAREAGHELWINLPFEQSGNPADDPGPRALLSNASIMQNEENMNWNLGATTGFSGVSSYTDDVFDVASATLQPLMRDAFRRGLGYIELNTSASDFLQTTAFNENAPYVKVDLHINDDNQDGSPFKKLEFIAQEKGYAVGVLKPRSSTLLGVSKWIETLEKKGIELVPVSYIAGRGVKQKAPPPQPQADAGHADESHESPPHGTSVEHEPHH